MPARFPRPFRFPSRLLLAVALLGGGGAWALPAARAEEAAPGAAATALRPLGPEAAARVLERLAAERRRQPGLTARFVESREMKELGRTVTLEGRLRFLAPDRLERVVDGAHPSVTTCNGHTVWIHYPQFDEVELYRLDDPRAGKVRSLADALVAGLNLLDLERHYETTLAAEPADAPAPGYRLLLQPRDETLRRALRDIEVRLGADLVVTRVVFTAGNGDRVTTTYSDVAPADLTPAAFEFTPPPGATVTEPLAGR